MTRREAILASVGVPLGVRATVAAESTVVEQPTQTHASLTGGTCPKCGGMMGRIEWNATACHMERDPDGQVRKWARLPSQLRHDCREGGEHLHVFCACGFGVTEKCLDVRG